MLGFVQPQAQDVGGSEGLWIVVSREGVLIKELLEQGVQRIPLLGINLGEGDAKHPSLLKVRELE
jgi:hypothetical protein